MHRLTLITPLLLTLFVCVVLLIGLVNSDNVFSIRPVITSIVYGSVQESIITANSPNNGSNDSKDQYLIELSSRKFIPSQGVNISALNMLKPEDDRVHYFLQVYNLQPSDSLINMTDDSGIEILQYVSGNAYIATSNFSEISGLENNGNIRWAGPILPADKISEDLTTGMIGEWANSSDDSETILTIQFHSDVNISQASDLITDFNGKVISLLPYISSITASFPHSSLNNSIGSIASEDSVQFIDVVDPPLEEQNDGARHAANVSMLTTNSYLPMGQSNTLTGKGIVIFLYDSRLVDFDHPDFRDRVVQKEISERIGEHSTHVAGTIGGSGINSDRNDMLGYPNGGTAQQWKGMAPSVLFKSFGASSADILYDDGSDLIANFHNATTSTLSVDLTSMSLGNNVVRNNLPCTNLGDYSNTAIIVDNIVTGAMDGNKAPFFKSVGNELVRNAPCGVFYTITAPATSKNSIGIGAVNSNDKSIYFLSSRGPTDDGRLKPDIVAPGCEIGNDNGITSTSINNSRYTRNGYIDNCGTSMATPAAAGVGALIMEEWINLHSTKPEPGTIKALLVHTATDLGNYGPDYHFGWGSVDAISAIDLLRINYMDTSNHTSRNVLIINDSIDHGETLVYPLVSDGMHDTKITIAWDDPPATRLALKTLINNLDIKLVDPEGISYSPLVLDYRNPAAGAEPGMDETNNVESVIGKKKPGTWFAYVNGTSVPTSPQLFTVIGSAEK